MNQDDLISIPLFTDPEERARARKAIERNKETHVGGEFRELMRFKTMMSLLSLGSSDEEVVQGLDEFDAAQAELDRVNGPPVEISLARLSLLEGDFKFF